MIIKSSRNSMKSISEGNPPGQEVAVSTPDILKSERPQPKAKPIKKDQNKSLNVKTEKQVEIKEEEIIEIPKKRSLLEEVLEEQTNLED